MTLQELAGRLLARLQRAGFSQREAYVKRGRSRRVEASAMGITTTLSEEQGWAVRAGSSRAAFFRAGSGAPERRLRWPQPDGRSLRLPQPQPRVPWEAPPDLTKPIVGEREAGELLESIGRGLRAEVPGGRLVEAVLEDGSSEAWLGNGHGVEAELRSRSGLIRLLAAMPADSVTAQLHLAAPAARRFDPRRVISRLATLLTARTTGRPELLDGVEHVLAPAIVARLLAGLAPLWTGAEAMRLAATLCDRPRGLAAPTVTIVDDPRHSGVLCGEPVDGEGLPTGETVLVEEGRYRQPLVDFRAAADGHGLVASGCCRRPSWRDVPAPGPARLYVRPDPSLRAADLIGSVRRGYYLFEAGGVARFDFEADRFGVPACGYLLQRGRASAPVAGIVLTGSIRALLRGVQAVASDLELLPLGPLYGGPTLLVTGVEVVAER